jgi:hypothetical protein
MDPVLQRGDNAKKYQKVYNKKELYKYKKGGLLWQQQRNVQDGKFFAASCNVIMRRVVYNPPFLLNLTWIATLCSQ